MPRRHARSSLPERQRPARREGARRPGGAAESQRAACCVGWYPNGSHHARTPAAEGVEGVHGGNSARTRHPGQISGRTPWFGRRARLMHDAKGTSTPARRPVQCAWWWEPWRLHGPGLPAHGRRVIGPALVPRRPCNACDRRQKSFTWVRVRPGRGQGRIPCASRRTIINAGAVGVASVLSWPCPEQPTSSEQFRFPTFADIQVAIARYSRDRSS
jgi:hypothetical protein